MSEEYMFWDRIVGEMQNSVDKAKAELKVNSLFLKYAIKERDKYPKPKNDTTTG